MRRILSILTFFAIGFVFSNCSSAKDITAAQKQSVIQESLNYALRNAEVSPYPSTVVSSFPGEAKWKMFKPVERQSSNGIKFRMWPFKISEAKGVVLSTVDLGPFARSQQKWAVSVSYTVYAYYNELEEFKFEVADNKMLSTQKIE